MKCSYCNNEIPDGQNFCQYCGKRISKKKFCRKCGYPLDVNVKFCRSCGTPVITNTPKSTYPVIESDNTNDPIKNLEKDNGISNERNVLEIKDPILSETDQQQYNRIVSQQKLSVKFKNDTSASKELCFNEDIDSPEYTEPKKKKGFIIAAIIFIILICVGGFVYWGIIDKTIGEDNKRVAQMEEKNSDNIEASVDDEFSNTIKDEDMDADDSQGMKIYVPSAANLVSSDAYEVYATIISDESMGDKWRNTDFIKNAYLDNMVARELSAMGNINGNSVRFDAVQLKNGTIYGRYNHSNGTKLDVNGVEDADENLIIKLGHGSATSYWVLHKDYLEDTGNAVVYCGTWGRNNLNSDLKIDIEVVSTN